ncbi:Dyp-type peroxidase [Hansschlegelia plantiphila]|uniref:Peroxidase n=1 Tax=Hansschlegelia plantiphila TaxID=374655 RepID=A0A9W6J4X9_9HYPH|nr:hypothetical protein [Hansschlegelia plantiphila]GLK69290.1 peroxidase [Hansschlegelia plantiphila]
MPINLAEPLDWESATGDALTMLEDLQGNILKGHGRHHTANLFLNFSGDRGKVAASLNSIGRQLPSALDQLRDAKAFSETKISAGRFLSFFISKEGYGWLGTPAPVSPARAPHSADATLESMLDRKTALDDPNLPDLDAHFRQDQPEKIIHALLLIADDGPEDVEVEASRWTWLLAQDGVSVIGAEYGRAYFNAAKDGLENFGYVDGRSQPLMLRQDIAEEGKSLKSGDPADPDSWEWSPIFPLGQFVVRDPGGATPHSFGSYFVFRKLEQDVEGFKEREEALAKALGLTNSPDPDDAERAGAMVVGRFENGSPYTMPKGPWTAPVSPDPSSGPLNNFNFDNDSEGALCPFRGHIRKTNPRGDSARLPGGTFDEEELGRERSRIMARRGITYGVRAQNVAREFVDRPRQGAGLLFMAYMANISEQFEVTQRFWANNAEFVSPPVGIDPVIGQTANGEGQVWWPDARGAPKKTEFDFGRFVHLKGGEYFFAPSKSFLTNFVFEPVTAAAEPVSEDASVMTTA